MDTQKNRNKKEVFYISRKWLNNDTDYGIKSSIVSRILNDKYFQDGLMMWSSYDLTLAISDCTRSISLDLDVQDDESWDNNLQKATILINEIKALRSKMIKARRRYKRDEKICKKNREILDKKEKEKNEENTK